MVRMHRGAKASAALVSGLLLAGIGLAACGGPGHVVSIYATGNNTGYVTDGTYPGAIHGIEPVVGDVDADVNGSTVRGLLEFRLDTIPQSAVITNAKLVVYQCLVAGDPYGKLGNVIATHVSYNDPFAASDFNSAPIGSALGVLSDNATLEKKSLVITTALSAAVKAGDPLFQVRLQESIFDGNSDGVTDYAAFATEGFFGHKCRGLTNDNPLLIVTYH